MVKYVLSLMIVMAACSVNSNGDKMFLSEGVNKVPYSDPNDPRKKESQRKAGKKWAAANKEKCREYNKKWSENNPGRINELSVIRRSQKLPPEKVLFYNAKNRAKAQNIPFDLEFSDIVVPDKCPILGIELKIATGCAKDYSPSVDRIIPHLGYVKGNIQIISHKANTIKSNATVEEIEKVYFHMKGEELYPLGVRLNNPGNIERADDEWVGMARLQDDPRFIRFLSPQYGLRAMMKILLTYEEDHGVDTIARIIARWAPYSENNTDAYIYDVSRRTGIPPNYALDMKDIDTLIKISKAIVIHENGYAPDNMPDSWYTEATYHAAAMMALKKRAS